jgi:hypothetical protein
MSPINRFNLFINICLAFITASMDVRGEELDGGPVDQLVDVLGIVTRALISVFGTSNK